MDKFVEVREDLLVPGQGYKLSMEMGDKSVPKNFWVTFSGPLPDGDLLLILDDTSYPLARGRGRFYERVEGNT